MPRDPGCGLLKGAGGKRDLSLSYGQIIIRVTVPPGFTFQVTTPNARVEALGTEFSVSFRESISVIALGRGRLRITGTLSDEKRYLEAGNSALVSPSIRVRPLDEIEILELKKIPGAGEGAAGEPREKGREYLRAVMEINRKIDDLKNRSQLRHRIQREEVEGERIRTAPLDRLRKEGKVLTMLHMKDGSRIAGSIISQDEREIRFDTADGIITIPKSEIIRRSHLE